MCEYDGAFVGQSGDWCNECPGFEKDDCFRLSDECRKRWLESVELPAAQPEKRTNKRTETHACDLISRQAAIDALRYAQHRFTVADEAGGMGTVKWSEDVIYFAAAERVLSELPSAQPEHKRGRWIYGEDNPGTGRDGWLCSKCGHFEMWDYSADMKSAELNLPNYCPTCGADMRGEQDDSIWIINAG